MGTKWGKVFSVSRPYKNVLLFLIFLFSFQLLFTAAVAQFSCNRPNFDILSDLLMSDVQKGLVNYVRSILTPFLIIPCNIFDKEVSKIAYLEKQHC